MQRYTGKALPCLWYHLIMLRTGIDVVEIERFRRAVTRHGEHLLVRLFTGQERAACGGNMASLAARLAAKEATAKALGVGIGAVGWRDIEVVTDARGAPHLVLSGAAHLLAERDGLTEWALSLSHSRGCAVAVVVARG